LDKNYELLKQRRKEAYNWKQDVDRLQARLKDYERDKVNQRKKERSELYLNNI
jgi:hypothetical protein